MANDKRLTVENFIGGHSVEASSDESISVLNPSTGEEIATVGLSSPADVDAAVASAAGAFTTWSSMTPADRSQRLHRLADLFEREIERFAELEVLDAGKPFTAAHDVEFPAIADALRHFAGGAKMSSGQAGGDYVSDHTFYLRREPLGVVGAITPWNYPLWQAVWKIGPALAAGNTIVVSPRSTPPDDDCLRATRVRGAAPRGHQRRARARPGGGRGPRHEPRGRHRDVHGLDARGAAHRRAREPDPQAGRPRAGRERAGGRL